MKRLIIFLLAYSAGNLLAQPVFTADNCFHPGLESQIRWTFLSGSYADAVMETGPDYTWDFSGLSWPEPTGTYLFQTGAESGNSTFANAGVNEYAEATFARDLFYTYSEDEDTLYYNGLVIGSNYAYTPAIPYFTFPMNFGDSLHHYTQLTAIVGNQEMVTGSTTRYWIYDGYGTVSLPYGTQQDVYRIRTVQTDSTYITNFAVTYQEIIWLRASDGLPVLRFQETGGQISVHHTLVSDEVSVEETSPATVMVYPNPAAECFSVISDQRITGIELMDASGRVLQNWTPAAQYDIGFLDEGTYVVRIVTDRSKYNRRLMVSVK